MIAFIYNAPLNDFAFIIATLAKNFEDYIHKDYSFSNNKCTIIWKEGR